MRTIFCCFLFFSSITVTSQNTILTVGGNYSNNNASISFSVGQLITAPISNASNSLYFGVQQPKELMALSIDDLTTISSMIYPNPTDGLINIKLTENLQYPYQLKLFDISGRLILSSSLIKSSTQLDIGNLSKGIYLVNISKNSNAIYNIKILKK